jgi:hypothetical protein
MLAACMTGPKRVASLTNFEYRGTIVGFVVRQVDMDVATVLDFGRG